jgi:hypothetical protein
VKKIQDAVSYKGFSTGDEDFLKMLEGCTAEINDLTEELTGDRFEKDWKAAVEIPDCKITRSPFNQTFAGPFFDYCKIRSVSLVICTLVRYNSLKEKNFEKAVKLLGAEFALIYQFRKCCIKNGGAALIDSMITLSLIGQATKAGNCILTADSSLPAFSIIKSRWEAIDSLLPFVGQSMTLEKGFVPDAFNQCFIQSNLTPPDIDPQWVKGEMDKYYPPQQWYSEPFVKVEKKMEEYSLRASELDDFYSCPSNYWYALAAPGKIFFRILMGIAVPNYFKAYMKECVIWADFRGTYVAVMLNDYKHRHGNYPDDLKALKSVKKAMLVDPYFGRSFTYKHDLEQTVLVSNQPEKPHYYLYLKK